MRKIEIDPAILDGISAALKEMQDKLDRAKQAQPEPVEFWEGQLVEMRDFDTSHWVVRKLEDFVGNVDFYSQGGTRRWNQCRPLQDPLILQFKPHKPGDPCPVPPGTKVNIKNDVGEYHMACSPAEINWSFVAAYMPAGGWGGE